MEIIKQQTVAIIGQPRVTEPTESVTKYTKRVITSLYRQGCTTFICGFSGEFDMIAASIVVSLRHAGYPNIKLVAVVTTHQQQADNLYPENQIRYKTLIKEADMVVTISDNGCDKVKLRQCDYILERSSQLICYYSGQFDDTKYAMRQAFKAEMRILNIWKLL